MKEVILTPDGYKKLQEEIEFLSNDKRREIADRIREAREFGDIAENAEYDSAKNEQAHLEARIAMLEERLKSARVVTKKEIKSGEVSVGTKVRLRDVKAGKTIEYYIVGSAEADPTENKLSNESPVGKAIMGKQEGRDGRGRGAARHAQVQDHGHQGGVSPRRDGLIGRPGTRSASRIATRSPPSERFDARSELARRARHRRRRRAGSPVA